MALALSRLGAALFFVATFPPTAGFSADFVVEVVGRNLKSPLCVTAWPGKHVGRPSALFAEEEASRIRWIAELRPMDQVARIETPNRHTKALLPLNEAWLLVAGTDSTTGERLLSVYAWTNDRFKLLQSISAGKEIGDGRLPARLAADDRHVFLSFGGQVHRARHNAGALGRLQPFLTLSEERHITALAMSEQGYLLVGTATNVFFHDPNAPAGKPLLTLKTDLQDLAGLEYGVAPRPSSRLLYALEGMQADEDRQGVYRIDAAFDADGKMACQTVKIAEVARPTAFALIDAETMAVVASGLESGDGRLIRITGGF